MRPLRCTCWHRADRGDLCAACEAVADGPDDDAYTPDAADEADLACDAWEADYFASGVLLP